MINIVLLRSFTMCCIVWMIIHMMFGSKPGWRPYRLEVFLGRIDQTENPRRWGRVGESERYSEYGNTTVVLPYVGHQMLNFILI